MINTSGGMTHGQGITDNIVTKWVPALPRCVSICDILEQVTGLNTATSEQHKDLRPSTQSRHNRDHVIFVQRLKEGTPTIAGYEPARLVSLSTGIDAVASVNCENVVEIGREAAAMVKRSYTSSYTEMTK